MITLTINGKKVRAKEDATLLEICRKMSISIPTLCYHPDLDSPRLLQALYGGGTGKRKDPYGHSL